MSFPVIITAAEEVEADTALAALSKLRDLLVRRDANHEACRVDEAIEAVMAAVRQPKRAAHSEQA